uniref:Uncharacterized protein n=1 Tax=Parastrongyloides trichosuri TaxID=131310 RepID=A0A0N4Z971_PARTI
MTPKNCGGKFMRSGVIRRMEYLHKSTEQIGKLKKERKEGCKRLKNFFYQGDLESILVVYEELFNENADYKRKIRQLESRLSKNEVEKEIIKKTAAKTTLSNYEESDKGVPDENVCDDNDIQLELPPRRSLLIPPERNQCPNRLVIGTKRKFPCIKDPEILNAFISNTSKKNKKN